MNALLRSESPEGFHQLKRTIPVLRCRRDADVNAETAAEFFSRQGTTPTGGDFQRQHVAAIIWIEYHGAAIPHWLFKFSLTIYNSQIDPSSNSRILNEWLAIVQTLQQHNTPRFKGSKGLS